MVDLSHIDMTAIVDQTDKLDEAEFFLTSARQENERRRFRWLVSAYFNAAYSYFDTAAVHAYHAFTSEDGDTLADRQALEILTKYIKIEQSKKDPFRIHTQAKNSLLKTLYEHRKNNTHYVPMPIMTTGPLPDDFQFGSEKGKGVPILALCTDIMNLMIQVQSELDEA